MDLIFLEENNMKDRCTDPKCKGFGKLLVDRGFGLPVCPSTKPSLKKRPMNPVFEGTF